jgi:hypothetical protein
VAITRPPRPSQGRVPGCPGVVHPVLPAVFKRGLKGWGRLPDRQVRSHIRQTNVQRTLVRRVPGGRQLPSQEGQPH